MVRKKQYSSSPTSSRQWYRRRFCTHGIILLVFRRHILQRGHRPPPRNTWHITRMGLDRRILVCTSFNMNADPPSSISIWEPRIAPSTPKAYITRTISKSQRWSLTPINCSIHTADTFSSCRSERGKTRSPLLITE